MAEKKHIFEDKEYTVRNRLTLGEVMLVCEQVANIVMSEDGDYRPELLDTVLDMYLISFYTDYEITQEIEEFYNHPEYRAIAEDVKSSADKNQLACIISAIDKKIDFGRETAVGTAAKHVADLAEAMKNMPAALPGVDLSQDEMKSVVDYIIKGGKMDEEKVVDALNKTKKRATGTRKKKTNNAETTD